MEDKTAVKVYQVNRKILQGMQRRTSRTKVIKRNFDSALLEAVNKNQWSFGDRNRYYPL